MRTDRPLTEPTNQNRCVRRMPPDVPPSDVGRVLDVGGGLRPHARADYVIDLSELASVRPYGNHDLLAGFSDDTWIVHDICSSAPWPFPDNFFDFAFCTHVLEDVRDPIRVCEEMTRVAKAGYIEVPSMESELTHRLESRHHVGRSHNRLLVEIAQSGVRFHMKPHFVNRFWKTQVPRSWWSSPPGDDVQGLLWYGSLTAEEVQYHYEELREFLEEFVRSLSCYPLVRYRAWEYLRAARRYSERISVRASRRQ